LAGGSVQDIIVFVEGLFGEWRLARASSLFLEQLSFALRGEAWDPLVTNDNFTDWHASCLLLSCRWVSCLLSGSALSTIVLLSNSGVSADNWSPSIRETCARRFLGILERLINKV